MNFEMSNGNDQMSELLARAREQSQALAERRAGVTPLPTLVRPDRSAARGAWLSALQTRFAVGGLTEFAAGNRAVLVRRSTGEKQTYRVRLDDLLKDGDVSANADVLPGDVLIGL